VLVGYPRLGGGGGGYPPTLADACLVPQCYSARRFGVDLAPWPRVEAIEAHCLSLAAFRHAAPEQQPDAQPDAQPPAQPGEGASHQ
jgi:glutathione S-transferase